MEAQAVILTRTRLFPYSVEMVSVLEVPHITLVKVSMRRREGVEGGGVMMVCQMGRVVVGVAVAPLNAALFQMLVEVVGVFPG